MGGRLSLTVVGLLLLSACGSSTLSLSEYSSEVASLIETLDGRLDMEAERYFSEPPNVEGLREYLAIRVDGYRTAVDGAEAISPPDEVEHLHTTLSRILGDLLVAEEARAEFAETIESVDDIPLVWEGPESQAISAAEQEAIVLCDAAQEQFDATESREAFGDVPWMPADLKDVVKVALNCP